MLWWKYVISFLLPCEFFLKQVFPKIYNKTLIQLMVSVAVIQLEGYIFPSCFTVLQRTSRKGEGGASQTRTKLDSESPTWKSGQHDGWRTQHAAPGSQKLPSSTWNGFNLYFNELGKYHCSFRTIVTLACGVFRIETGYLGCHPALFWHKAEHSFVSNTMKMMFFNHLYAVTAVQVLVLQQELHICLRTHDVSSIFAWTMDLWGLL